MTILFLIHRNRSNHKGECPIVLRITYNKTRENIRTGLYIHPESWDSKKQKVKGTSETAKQLNNQIQTHKLKILKAYDELLRENKPFGCRSIVERYSGKHVVITGIIEAAQKYNNEIAARIGIEFTKSTYIKAKSLLFKLRRFIKHQYNREDISLTEVTRKTITELDLYLKSVLHNQTNTVYKNMQYVKRVLKYCRINDLISHNPFDTYKFKTVEGHREYLTMEEIQKLMDHVSSTPRLETVRNVFLVQCFTGLSHADVFKLNSSHIEVGVDNKLWIKLTRTKTNSLTQVPVLPVAETILKKYTQDPECIKNGKVLPVICNQSMNRALKDLALEVGINKRICTHTARHSYATTILLSNGVRIETVSKLLAHSSIKVTQIYAKITEIYLSKEVENLSGLLDEKFKKL